MSRVRQSSSKSFHAGWVNHMTPTGSWIQTLDRFLAWNTPSHESGSSGTYNLTNRFVGDIYNSHFFYGTYHLCVVLRLCSVLRITLVQKASQIFHLRIWFPNPGTSFITSLVRYFNIPLRRNTLTHLETHSRANVVTKVLHHKTPIYYWLVTGGEPSVSSGNWEPGSGELCP